MRRCACEKNGARDLHGSGRLTKAASTQDCTAVHGGKTARASNHHCASQAIASTHTYDIKPEGSTHQQHPCMCVSLQWSIDSMQMRVEPLLTMRCDTSQCVMWTKTQWRCQLVATLQALSRPLNDQTKTLGFALTTDDGVFVSLRPPLGCGKKKSFSLLCADSVTRSNFFSPKL